MPSFLIITAKAVLALFFLYVVPHRLDGYPLSRFFLIIPVFSLIDSTSSFFIFRTNLTVAEVTVPVDNVDADPLMPSIEVLTVPHSPDIPGYSEIPTSEPNSVDSPQVIQTEETNSNGNNLLNVSNNATRSNESGSSEDDIPSFSEWTLKVLAEEEKSGKLILNSQVQTCFFILSFIGANGSSAAQAPSKVSGTPKLRQKNYASPDCGAKILAANSEAEHTSAVLEPSRDEYFLSICSTKIWFVIELCEAIQAQRVSRRELFLSLLGFISSRLIFRLK